MFTGMLLAGAASHPGGPRAIIGQGIQFTGGGSESFTSGTVAGGIVQAVLQHAADGRGARADRILRRGTVLRGCMLPGVPRLPAETRSDPFLPSAPKRHSDAILNRRIDSSSASKYPDSSEQSRAPPAVALLPLSR